MRYQIKMGFLQRVFTTFLLSLILCISTHCVSAETYYVTPTANTSCPEEGVPCMTLSQYGTTPSGYFASDTSLILLPGNHSLDSSLTITNITNLSFLTNITYDYETKIWCSLGARLRFQEIEQLNVSDLAFVGCQTEAADIQHFFMEHCKLEGSNLVGSRLDLVTVYHTVITKSLFTTNIQVNGTSNERENLGVLYANSSDVAIGNSTFDGNYAANGSSVFAVYSSVFVLNSDFTNNIASTHGGAIMAINESTIVIEGSTFTNNSVKTGEGGQVFQYTGGGAVSVISSTIVIYNSNFTNNTAEAMRPNGGSSISGGALAATLGSSVIIEDCMFVENKASHSGGAVAVGFWSETEIRNSMFISNIASSTLSNGRNGGGAIAVIYSVTEVDSCMFSNNAAMNYGGGGGIAFLNSSAIVTNTDFMNNIGNRGGGAIVTVNETNCFISNCSFNSNTARAYDGHGGAIECENSNTTIENSEFNSNTIRRGSGGAVNFYCDGVCGGSIENTTFIANHAAEAGGAISLHGAHIFINDGVQFYGNSGSMGVFFAAKSAVFFNGNTLFSDNDGSVFVFTSNVSIVGQVSIMDNTCNDCLDQGGALTSYQSNVYFIGTISISNCSAMEGGAISSTASRIFTYGNLTIAKNVALGSGGGIHTYQGELNCFGSVSIENNTAQGNGGGVYALGTTITLFQGSLSLKRNNAIKGGGIYLESNAKLLVTKQRMECKDKGLAFITVCESDETKWLRLQFIDNSADFGGAIYFDDDTTSNICNANSSETFTSTSECLIQTLSIYSTNQIDNLTSLLSQINHVNIYFLNNTAVTSDKKGGNSIYGGLLDRCKPSPFAEILIQSNKKVSENKLDAVQYYNTTSNLQIQDISSDSVRMCFCLNHQPDCSYQPGPINVRKGEEFNVSVVAVDQVKHKTGYRFINSVVQTTGLLNRDQVRQKTKDGCTNLTYTVSSRLDIETITIYPEGPCRDRGISVTTLQVDLMGCPIGFRDTEIGCRCDLTLRDYLFECRIESQSVIKKSENTWLWFDNATSQKENTAVYLASRTCSFDYCNSEKELNFNVRNGADVQCAFNRSGRLCGRCDKGLSLLLGGPRCAKCSNNGLALLLFFAIAGIALVVLILMCNLTVAVGTINGLIFYANIVAANRSTFFPQNTGTSKSPNILAVFIAWLNLDFGFQTCFYDGMDGHAQTWLQLVFPSYIIFLVILLIVISEKSQFVSKLISNCKQNPLAALATLILLSYTKILRLIIAGLSLATIQRISDERRQNATATIFVWKVDATLDYLPDPRRVPLFLVSLLIAAVSLVFTVLLFFWQCLLRCPNRHPMKWVSNPRLRSFIDAYHAPYKDRHRYWLGLQLFARAALYTVIAIQFEDQETQIDMLVVSIAAGTLLLLTNLTGGGPYKKWTLNILENSFLFNLLIFAIATSYIRETGKSQAIITNISTTVAIITFIGILVYHSCAFVLLPIASYYGLKEKLQNIYRKKRNRKEAVNANTEHQISGERLTEVPRFEANNFSELRGSLEMLETETGSEVHSLTTVQHQSEVGKLVNVKKVRVVTHGVIDGVTYSKGERLDLFQAESEI